MQINGQTVYIAATSKGLCYLGGPNETYNEMEKWLLKHYKDYTFVQQTQQLEMYITAIHNYISGVQNKLDLPLHLKGTPFQMDVWRALQEIPYGETVSYSQVAEKIGKLSAVRAVGGAIGANPVMIFVPCHRVIGKNGQLTGFRGGLEMKKYLLELEYSHNIHSGV